MMATSEKEKVHRPLLEEARTGGEEKSQKVRRGGGMRLGRGGRHGRGRALKPRLSGAQQYEKG